MARLKILWGVAAIMLGMVTLAAAEEDNSAKADGVQVGATADVFSKYIWRGQNVVDDWVLQPGASVGYKGLTGSIWGNMDLTGEVVGEGSLTETDLTLDYSNNIPGLDSLGYSVGAIYYSFLNTNSHPTAEVYGGLTASVPLSPGVRWYYDFDQIKGSYVQFSLGHTIEKIRTWGRSDECHCDVQLGASLGLGTAEYNEGYFGVDQTALNDLTLTAGLPICFGKLTIKPSVGYSMMVDKDIRAATDKSDNFWVGVGAAYNF
jgi:hypothetical protein